MATAFESREGMGGGGAALERNQKDKKRPKEFMFAGETSGLNAIPQGHSFRNECLPVNLSLCNYNTTIIMVQQTDL